jgi:hypothetical protein
LIGGQSHREGEALANTVSNVKGNRGSSTGRGFDCFHPMRNIEKTACALIPAGREADDEGGGQMMSLLDELLAVENQRCEAWLARNREALGSVLDDDFAEINYFGRLSKTDVLDDLFARLQLQNFVISEPRVHGIPESPILSYSCFERILVDGAHFEGRFHVASHFVRRGSIWKILLWQITPLAESATKSATEMAGASQIES